MGKKEEVSSPHQLHEWVQDLKKSALRVTAPRMTILKAMLDCHGPSTVEEIHLRTKRVNKLTKDACDLATVYRFVSHLEKLRIVQRCEFGDGMARYELLGQHGHHHHHVICRSCQRIEILKDCEIKEMSRFAEKRGFVQISHSLEFSGICLGCQKNARSRA